LCVVVVDVVIRHVTHKNEEGEFIYFTSGSLRDDSNTIFTHNSIDFITKNIYDACFERAAEL
jgi:hypothetical protein